MHRIFSAKKKHHMSLALAIMAALDTLNGKNTTFQRTCLNDFKHLLGLSHQARGKHQMELKLRAAYTLHTFLRNVLAISNSINSQQPESAKKDKRYLLYLIPFMCRLYPYRYTIPVYSTTRACVATTIAAILVCNSIVRAAGTGLFASDSMFYIKSRNGSTSMNALTA